MGKMAVRYAVVDAFTSTAFRGNPAAVCWLEEPRGDEWMQSVAAEFNISQTAFLSRAAGSTKFQLRWFTPTVEVELCGHATLAASHFLLTSGLEASNVIEFNTKSGVLTAKRVDGENQLGNSKISNGRKNKFSIELDFPMVSIVDCDETEIPLIPESLKGASVVDVKKTTAGDLIVELKSGKEVADVQPQISEIQKCAGRGVIITGLAPASSGFDFFSRFFCPKCGINEVELCGHATLAASHFLLTSGLETSNVIEFNTKSGVLTAKRVNGENQLGNSKISNGRQNKFSIELDFPMISVVDCDETEIPLIPESLKGASVVDVKKTTAGDLIVELKSGKEVADVQPRISEIQKCAGRGVIITGLAPASSGFDFFSRFFCPKCGINEDPVCGSVHCALAPYWSKKMGKNNFIAYMASSRGGRLDVQLEEENRRVRIRGEAITIMEGTLRV